MPDIYSVPKEIAIDFLKTEKNNLAIFRSKAVGEPPLMYGIGVFFALRNAIKNFNAAVRPAFDAPMTPEKVLMNLYNQPNKEEAAEAVKGNLFMNNFSSTIFIVDIFPTKTQRTLRR